MFVEKAADSSEQENNDNSEEEVEDDDDDDRKKKKKKREAKKSIDLDTGAFMDKKSLKKKKSLQWSSIFGYDRKKKSMMYNPFRYSDQEDRRKKRDDSGDGKSNGNLGKTR